MHDGFVALDVAQMRVLDENFAPLDDFGFGFFHLLFVVAREAHRLVGEVENPDAAQTRARIAAWLKP